MSSPKQLIDILHERRTIYHLNNKLPVSESDIVAIVKAVVAETPSSFNNQTTRAVILFGDKHLKLWDGIAHDALLAKIGAERFKDTAPKLKGFAAGAGTVLFFEDDEAIKQSQDGFPSYAANFPIWAAHSSGAAQINTWAAFATVKVGANLQHYSPLIDQGVAETFNIPKNWSLKAQLVFGGIESPAGQKEVRHDTVVVA